MTDSKKLSPEALSALSTLNKTYTEAKSQRMEDEWPPAGNHGCVITGLDIRPYDKVKTQTCGECAGFFVQFRYTTLEAIPGSRKPGEPMDWRGSSRRIVTNPNVYAKNNQEGDPEWSLCKDLNELKDALSILLARGASSLHTDLMDAVKKIESERVVAMVRVYEKANKKNPAEPYRTDYINGLLG